jgi:apolipoprotein N-acyltransferase
MVDAMLYRLGRFFILPVASGLLLALSFPSFDVESLAWRA